MASGSHGSHDAPLLVFHQCMDKEWLAWGRESAQEFARQGFAVIRSVDTDTPGPTCVSASASASSSSSAAVAVAKTIEGGKAGGKAGGKGDKAGKGGKSTKGKGKAKEETSGIASGGL